MEEHALDCMPRKWGQRKHAVAITHEERQTRITTLYDILAIRLSGQRLLYLRGSGHVFFYNMLSGTETLGERIMLAPLYLSK